MKKILFFISLAMLTIGSTSAQIQTTHTHEETITLYGPKAGVSLHRMTFKDEYEYYIQLRTSNQFDKPMLLLLGNKTKTIQSLEGLLNGFELDKTSTMREGTGKEFIAIGASILGADGYYIKMSGYAGYAYIRLSDFRKMLKVIQ